LGGDFLGVFGSFGWKCPTKNIPQRDFDLLIEVFYVRFSAIFTQMSFSCKLAINKV
jgi:hypothetical protein